MSNEAIWENKINLEFAALSNARSVCVYVCVTLVKSPLGDFWAGIIFHLFPLHWLDQETERGREKEISFPNENWPKLWI